MPKHWIDMSGSRGCLPDHCDVSFDRKIAVASLVQLFELGKTRARLLARNSFLSLRPNDGAEYCEITECGCTSPWDHSDMTEQQFKLEHADDLARLTLCKPVNAVGCFELVDGTGERSILIQTDFDYPGLASNFGFVPCDKGCGTDGTVDCEHATATDMISRAYDFLIENIGASCDDPGYFEN